MTTVRRWIRWVLMGRPMDVCGRSYPCAHRAYNPNCNHPMAGGAWLSGIDPHRDFTEQGRIDREEGRA